MPDSPTTEALIAQARRYEAQLSGSRKLLDRIDAEFYGALADRLELTADLHRQEVERVGRLEARLAALADLEPVLEEIESWYPLDVFPPLLPGELNPMVDRVSAHMARHVIRVIREKLALAGVVEGR